MESRWHVPGNEIKLSANRPWGIDKPENDAQIRGDAFKTLFVARLNYDTKEADLEREFGRFGPIERVGILPLRGPAIADDRSLTRFEW